VLAIDFRLFFRGGRTLSAGIKNLNAGQVPNPKQQKSKNYQ
jgi:hypothetical protein